MGGGRESGYFWLRVSLSKSGHRAKHADGGRREGGRRRFFSSFFLGERQKVF